MSLQVYLQYMTQDNVNGDLAQCKINSDLAALSAIAVSYSASADSFPPLIDAQFCPGDITTRCHFTSHFSLKCSAFSWQRGSVIRASVSDWRTFPDKCLIYG